MKSWRTARIEPLAAGKHWDDRGGAGQLLRSAGRGGDVDGAVRSGSGGRVQTQPTEMKTKLELKASADPESENRPGGGAFGSIGPGDAI